MKKKVSDAPYMVASYIRCEDVRHLRSQISIERCSRLLVQYTGRVNKDEAFSELQKETEKILRLEKRVYELEKRSFLNNREAIISASMTIDVIKEVLLSFSKNTLLFETALDEYIKATN